LYYVMPFVEGETLRAQPENILLQAGQPVIADFGIALAVAQAGGERITETGLSLARRTT
jgi:serine/threonine protein kinase